MALPNNTRLQPGLPVSYLAWVAALLPMITVHVSYIIAASTGAVEWCLPYWDSCTSISATGRQLPAKFIFKLGMIPTAIFTLLLWWLLWRWCQLAGASKSVAGGLAMPVLGSLAAVFLIQYTLALGELGDSYRWLRRTGVVLAFSLTYIAQLLFIYRIKGIATFRPELMRFYRPMLALLVLLLLVGVVSMILDAVLGAGYDAIEDAFEWWMALLLNGFFILLAILLKQQGVRMDVRL